MTRSPASLLVRAVFALVGLGPAACVDSGEVVPADAISVGLLAPFTGGLSADGINDERAVLLAVEAVNGRGGVAGKPLHLISRDTHSDIDRGLNGAEELFAAGVIAMIGPDDLELVLQLAAPLASAGVGAVLPGLTSNTALEDASDLWVRISPAAEQLGCALAQDAFAHGCRRIAVVYSTQKTDQALAAALTDTLVWYNNGPSDQAQSALFEVSEGSSSFAALVAALTAFAPDTVVLTAPPVVAARIVQDVATSLPSVRWFLGPALQSDAFFTNIPPGALTDALTVTAAVPDAAARDAFTDRFAARWAGDTPFLSAYFYYDAMAMLALAIERAAVAGGGVPERTAVIAELRAFSALPGARVYWDELARGIDMIEQGQPVDYQGLTGPLTLDDKGKVDVGFSLFALWRREDGVMRSKRQIVCTSSP